MTTKLKRCSLTDIIIFPNGMVAVCNNKGEQVPMLQGRYSEKKKILLYLMKRYPEIKVRGNPYQTKREWENEWNFYLPYLLGALQ